MLTWSGSATAGLPPRKYGPDRPHITSHHIASHHIASHRITSHHIASHHIALHKSTHTHTLGQLTTKSQAATRASKPQATSSTPLRSHTHIHTHNRDELGWATCPCLTRILECMGYISADGGSAGLTNFTHQTSHASPKPSALKKQDAGEIDAGSASGHDHSTVIGWNKEGGRTIMHKQ